VQRQTVVATAIRKLSQHSYGNFSSNNSGIAGKGSTKLPTGNLLNLVKQMKIRFKFL
jgi:hypothetical protein